MNNKSASPQPVLPPVVSTVPTTLTPPPLSVEYRTTARTWIPKIPQPRNGGKTTMLSPGDLEDTIGKLPAGVVDKYRIRRPLGWGGFGVVYLADDIKIGRLVAIKQLFQNWAENPEFGKRLMQEARIAGKLGHLNIVSIFNVEEEAGSYFCIIMEYLGGGSLDDLLKKEGSLAPCQALEILAGVLSGLDAAHHLMIVHSDIKPSNILFGVGGIPKIADFGMSKCSPGSLELSDSSEFSGLDTSIGGTPQYMSPEQAALADYDCRSDLYSAGVVLYRMLAGEDLIPADADFSDVKSQVCSATPKPLSSFRDDIPDFVEKLMLLLLAKDPVDRPQNANDALRETLKAIARLKDLTPSSAEMLFKPPCQITTSPAAILEDIISLLLVDGAISAPERVELDRRAEKLGFGEAQLHAIETRVRIEKGLPLEAPPSA